MVDWLVGLDGQLLIIYWAICCWSESSSVALLISFSSNPTDASFLDRCHHKVLLLLRNLLALVFRNSFGRTAVVKGCVVQWRNLKLLGLCKKLKHSSTTVSTWSMTGVKFGTSLENSEHCWGCLFERPFIGTLIADFNRGRPMTYHSFSPRIVTLDPRQCSTGIQPFFQLPWHPNIFWSERVT